MIRYILPFGLFVAVATPVLGVTPAFAQAGCDARMAQSHKAQMTKLSATTKSIRQKVRDKNDAAKQIYDRYMSYIGSLASRAANPRYSKCAAAQLRHTVSAARSATRFAGGTTPPGTTPGQRKEMVVCLKAYNNKHYVVAERDKKTVNANRPRCDIWEHHALIDLNGGQLLSGDKVALRTYWKLYWSAQPNGRLEANRSKLDIWEKFTIRKMSGPGGRVITYGNKVAFLGAHKKYVVAEKAGGAVVNVNRAAPKQWETFLIEKPGGSTSAPPSAGIPHIKLLPQPTRLARGRVIAPPQKIRHGAVFGYSFWIQPQIATANWTSILHKGRVSHERGPAILFFPRVNRLHVRISTERNRNDGRDSKSPLPTQRWSHIFVQFSPGAAEIYVNGRLNNRCPIGKQIRLNNGPLYAGSPWYDAARAAIRDLRLYTRPLTSAQVARLRRPGS